jgi:phage major head subunit gpT-like protein
MLINKSNISAVSFGFRTIYNSAFTTAPSDFARIAMIITSISATEKYGWLGKTTRFREWLGDRVIQNLMAHDYEIKNKTFENTVGVAREDIEDDNYGVYNPMISQLGIDAKQHPDELIFALVKAGFNTACYDGQYFFDDDHPVLDEKGDVQSVSNMQAGSAEPWYLFSTKGAVKPFIFQKRRDYQFVPKDDIRDDNVFHQKQFIYGVDARVNAGYGLWQLAHGSKATLNATNYGLARTAMMSLKGDNGKPLNIKPDLLVVPPALEAAALEIVTAERNAAGATNIYRNTTEVLVTPWLA